VSLREFLAFAGYALVLVASICLAGFCLTELFKPATP
jgi:hypothetical protein